MPTEWCVSSTNGDAIHFLSLPELEYADKFGESLPSHKVFLRVPTDLGSQRCSIPGSGIFLAESCGISGTNELFMLLKKSSSPLKLPVSENGLASAQKKTKVKELP
jgi:hypothetical protein